MIKLHVIAIRGLNDGPGPTKALITGVEREMKKGGEVNSASGRTAALAINWCERWGRGYTLTRLHGRYHVKVAPPGEG